MLAKLWPLWAALAVLNLITFIVYAVDKRIAQQRKGRRRVPERTLLLLAFCGGCVGGAAVGGGVRAVRAFFLQNHLIISGTFSEKTHFRRIWVV